MTEQDRPHYRPIALPQCDSCRESATDEIWQSGRLVGVFCPRDGYEKFMELLRLWQSRQQVREK